VSFTLEELEKFAGKDVAQDFIRAEAEAAQAQEMAAQIGTLRKKMEAIRQGDLHRAYFAGVRDGLTRYAHWKDGVQYVGSCGKTLEKALAEVNEEERNKCQNLENYL
jgi:predicted heme/steroid binding protein